MVTFIYNVRDYTIAVRESVKDIEHELLRTTDEGIKKDLDNRKKVLYELLALLNALKEFKDGIRVIQAINL
jgi:hypothetical protein